MDDVKLQAPFCTLFPPGDAVSDCGSSGGGTIFFVSFVILNSYLLSNLFVAAIMEYVVSGLLRQGAIVNSRDLEVFQVSRIRSTLDMLWVNAIAVCRAAESFGEHQN